MVLRHALMGGASLLACSVGAAWAQSSPNVQSAPQSTAGALTAPQASQANTSDASASPATARPTPITGNTSASTGAQIQEVIVTARRRAENIQNVPVAITALSGATLTQQHIETAYDLIRVTPSLNVNISAGGGQNQEQYTIRGQRQGDTLPSVDPAVGVYVGDIVYERPFGFGQMLYDLSNVQVLKGPQGTLFGRGTFGGDIVAQPNLPTNRYDGSIHAELGDYNLHEVDGYVNLPLSDKAQLRIAAQHTDRDGYIHDVTTGQDDENENESAARISLRLRPIDKLENVTVVNYLTRDTNGSGWKLDYVQSQSPTAPIQAYNAYGPAFGLETATQALANSQKLGYYQTASTPGQPTYAHARVQTFANTTTYTVDDHITLKNIIGYIHYKANYFDDIDGSPLPVLGYNNDAYGNQITEEAQVLGKYTNLNWILGGYYFQERAYENSFTPSEVSPFNPEVPQQIPEHDNNTSYSVFGSGTYDFSQFIPRLSATFGGRYTWDERSDYFGTILSLPAPLNCAFAFFSGTPFAVPYNTNTCLTHQKADFQHFTYNVDVDYKITPDKLVYFAHRLGYRPGGFGTRSLSTFDIEYQPDTVNDYEVGAKFDWRFYGMFLRTNLAAFYQNYSNLQRLVPVQTANGESTTQQNVGQASLDGAEAEFTFVPIQPVTISGFFSQAQPVYEQYNEAFPAGSPACSQANATQSAGGCFVDIHKTAYFAGFPRTTFGFTGRYTLPTPERIGQTVLQVNYYHQSPYVGQDNGDPQYDAAVPGYGLLNFRAEWNKVFGTELDLAGFVTNALDHKYLAVSYTLADIPFPSNGIGFASGIAGAPRMFGFEGRYHFGG